jgi:exonuclease SbcD
MRILHTSDWHLGQHFMGKSRQAEHQALIDWLLQQVEAHAVDALLLLAGNHDSVATLGESSALLERLNATVVAAVADPASHIVVLPLRGGEPGCIVCAVPFIRPRDVLQSQAGQSAEEKQQSMQAAIQAYYQSVYEAGRTRQAELAQALGRTLPLLATGHLTTVGASSNESVREIYVGSLEAFPTAAFPPVDYVALGHIHKPQKVGGLEHIRYCGSPIALGFDEARQQKEVLLVDLNADGLAAVTALPVPRFQPLLSVSGNLLALAGAIGAAAEQGSPEQAVWLEVTVEEDDYLADLPARIETMTQGLPVEVLRVRRLRGNAAASLPGELSETLDELSPDDVFARRLALEELAPELQLALNQRYRAVVTSLMEDAA